MSLAAALLLGALQGLTEFVPVSSTAHLYIAQTLLKIQNDEIALSFDVVLHLGTAAALVAATWKDLSGLLREFFIVLSGKPARDPVERALLLPLLAGTVPGALAGLFLLKRIEGMRTLGLIGFSMLAACAFFFYSERRDSEKEAPGRSLSELTLADALWIGLAQAAAGLFAGFSRSGFTIGTGRLRGLRREESARFSFLLALPIILGAGAKTLLDLWRIPHPAMSPAVLVAGFLSAGVFGYLSVGFLLRYLKTHSLRPFAVYLGALGLVLLAVSLAGGQPSSRAV